MSDWLPTDAPTSRTVVGSPTRCRHLWERTIATMDLRSGGDITPDVGPWRCFRCGKPKDEQRSRRGRTSLRAGKDAERAIAKAYPNGVRVGQFGGPSDVNVGELLIVQSKAGGWFTERYWTELQKLPRTGGRVPMLVVSDRPGPGHRTRRYVVMAIDDHVALLGRDGLEAPE